MLTLMAREPHNQSCRKEICQRRSSLSLPITKSYKKHMSQTKRFIKFKAYSLAQKFYDLIITILELNLQL